MSEHLAKAKLALVHAAELDVDLTDTKESILYVNLLAVARVQAEVAQAEALERIADKLI